MLHADSTLPLTGLANYGLAGVVLLILLTFGWLEITHERQRTADIQARLDEAQEQLADLNTLIREKYVKGLEESVHALEESRTLIAILRDNLRARPP